ncbi:MAG: electron transport complex subunit E [Clostridiales bacterium]|nr:electron transport complex subunit E [Clostridiales bacterium]
MDIKNLTKGIIKENPIFIQVLGMCPTLAVTTSAINGLGMGLATTAVLALSNVFISMFRKVIPDKIRIPAFIVIIASFVTIIGMLLEGYFVDLYKALGLFIPLIVVNCIILARAEAFAFKNNVIDSLFDGIGNGIGFTLALLLLGSVRELLGAGSIFGISLLGAAYKPALIMILPPGAFLALGILLAINNKIKERKTV